MNCHILHAHLGMSSTAPSKPLERLRSIRTAACWWKSSRGHSLSRQESSGLLQPTPSGFHRPLVPMALGEAPGLPKMSGSWCPFRSHGPSSQHARGSNDPGHAQPPLDSEAWLPTCTWVKKTETISMKSCLKTHFMQSRNPTTSKLPREQVHTCRA